MIGEAVVFGGSSNAAVAVMALIFAAVFGWFVVDCLGTSDHYDRKVATWLGFGYVVVGGVVAVLA